MNLYSADAAMLATFFEAVGAGVIVFDVHDQHALTPLCTNAAFRALYGLEHQSSTGQGDALLQEIPRILGDRARECVLNLTPIDFEHPLKTSAATRWQRVRMIPVSAQGNGGYARVFATVVDVTAKRRLEQEIQIAYARLRSIFDSSSEGIITIDTDQKIKTINEAAMNIFGYSSDEAVGQTMDILIPERFRARHPHYVRQFHDSEEITRPMENRIEITGRRKDGSEFMAEVAIAKVDAGTDLELAAFVRDVSEHMRLMDELHLRASTDPLTGLYNRRHMFEAAAKELNRAMRFGHPASVVLIDLDDFKGINDTFGHLIGDKVLREVSSVCQHQIRQSDIIARWGGEEFLLLLPETDGVGAMRFAERLQEGLKRIQKDAPELEARRVTASIGIAAHRDEDDSFEAMVRRADEAMYTAKNTGKNKIVPAD
jgi:diguanylate cyclase (GGDEF)-like protein/PAS domain S-box-containing protein